MEILYAVIAILVLFLLLRFLSIPLRAIKWLIVNGVSGLIILFFVNLIGQGLGFNIETNLLNTLIAGVFGIPGVLILLLVS
ncbi:MAG: pro-sigmaK processing inhibitor BofA family protein [Tissierellia bacterium]|nr:pro-sigmaK processing inhibitor BofA family protein [Tissierellia bacterium]